MVLQIMEMEIQNVMKMSIPHGVMQLKQELAVVLV
jgi:hypothetical protein